MAGEPHTWNQIDIRDLPIWDARQVGIMAPMPWVVGARGSGPHTYGEGHWTPPQREYRTWLFAAAAAWWFNRRHRSLGLRYTAITAQSYNDLLSGRMVVCKVCGRMLYLPE